MRDREEKMNEDREKRGWMRDRGERGWMRDREKRG